MAPGDLLINPNLPAEERNRALFGGALALASASPATLALSALARRMIGEAFGELDPATAQHSLDVREFVDIVGPLKSAFTNCPESKEAVRDVIAEYGYDLGSTHFDVPRLRVAPSGNYLTAGVSYAYKAHRDTWYAAPMSQINWWLPVFDVTPDQVMLMWPTYFNQPVPNSSANFDYDDWQIHGRQDAASQVEEDTRNHPLPSQDLDEPSALRIAGSAGDVLMFSACFLHATAPNTSGRTRFSVDFRTLSTSDLHAERGGPNVDAECTGSTIADFLSAESFEHVLA